MCVGGNPTLLWASSLQDLCQLVNADAPYWLVGMTEMTRTFGLELLESVLNDFPEVFLQVHAASHETDSELVFLSIFVSSDFSVALSAACIYLITLTSEIVQLTAAWNECSSPAACVFLISSSVSHAAPGVQLPAEGARLSPRHQALLAQHQVPPGLQRHFAGARGETVLPHLHEAAARGLGPHQALLHIAGEGPMVGRPELIL